MNSSKMKKEHKHPSVVKGTQTVW